MDLELPGSPCGIFDSVTQGLSHETLRQSAVADGGALLLVEWSGW
jgi:hypothetical protein